MSEKEMKSDPEGQGHLMEEVKSTPRLREGAQVRTGGPTKIHPRVSVSLSQA